jgi:sugar O-acyltransferase (sialic acid O-acetyltransferase NeuD family)
MESIAIYGAGGFGKETKFLLDAINRNKPQYVFQGFLDDRLSGSIKIAEIGKFACLAIAIASPAARLKVYEKCGMQFSYPALIEPHVYIDQSVSLGKGLIICAGVKITVDVELGDFVIINLNATIGHDVRIGAFTSIMPSVNISGNVRVGEEVFIGSGVTVLQGLTVGNGAIIGAGAVVTKNVPPGVTVKGVPARW